MLDNKVYIVIQPKEVVVLYGFFFYGLLIIILLRLQFNKERKME